MRTICLDCLFEDGTMEIKSNVDPLFFLSLRAEVGQMDNLDGVEDIIRKSMESSFQHDVWERFESMVEAERVIGIWTWSFEVEIIVVVLVK